MTESKRLNEFYQYCLTTCSPRRIPKIKNVITKAKSVIKKDLTKINVNDVVKFLAYINQSDYKAWTKNDYKKIFKRFLKWQYKNLDMIEGNKVKEGFRLVSARKAFNKEKINEYHIAINKLVKDWLNDEGIVQEDRKRLKKAIKLSRRKNC